MSTPHSRFDELPDYEQRLHSTIFHISCNNAAGYYYANDSLLELQNTNVFFNSNKNPRLNMTIDYRGRNSQGEHAYSKS